MLLQHASKWKLFSIINCFLRRSELQSNAVKFQINRETIFLFTSSVSLSIAGERKTFDFDSNSLAGNKETKFHFLTLALFVASFPIDDKTNDTFLINYEKRCGAFKVSPPKEMKILSWISTLGDQSRAEWNSFFNKMSFCCYSTIKLMKRKNFVEGTMNCCRKLKVQEILWNFSFVGKNLISAGC